MGDIFLALQAVGFAVGILVGGQHHIRRLGPAVLRLVHANQRGVGLAAEGADIVCQPQVQRLGLAVLSIQLIGVGQKQQAVVIFRVYHVADAEAYNGRLNVARVHILLTSQPVRLGRYAAPLL